MVAKQRHLLKIGKMSFIVFLSKNIRNQKINILINQKGSIPFTNK